MVWLKVIMWIAGIVLATSVFDLDKNFLGSDIIPVETKEGIKDALKNTVKIFDFDNSTTVSTTTTTNPTNLTFLGKPTKEVEFDCTSDSECNDYYNEGVCIDGSCWK